MTIYIQEDLQNSPVERTGRFWTLIPKLFRGSSLSREDRGSAEGAGTAADCTERAGESSLELLLESLWQRRNRKVFITERLSVE